MTVRRALAVGAMFLAGLTTSAIGAEAPDTPTDTQWPSYNLTVDGQRFSPLSQITVDNASRLGEVCRIKLEDVGSMQTGLVQVHGVIYLTTTFDTWALDAADCSVRWHHVWTPEQDPVFLVNRGVAYSNGMVFRGTPDARLLALDAKTGQVIWQHQVGDPQQGEFVSAAPQVFQGLLIVGTAGGDFGIRGRIMAYDINTGQEKWRFHTIPRGDEQGAASWKNSKTARYGGGGSWTTYTLDMATGEVFVPVGNPAPDFIPHERPGENLYANSMVVLDANTGKLKWYHQLISNDGHDLDLGAAPMLTFNGKGEPIVVIGGKDGYVYGIERDTHKRLFKTPITTIKNPGVVPTVEGIEACPGPLGGVEWNGPAWDKKNKGIVVGTVDWCAILTRDKEWKYKPGAVNLAGMWKFPGPGKGWVVALDPDTGAVRWKYETAGPQVAGITPTAGGVTFSGDMLGNFFALDSATGRELFKAQTGGAMAGGVITYLKGGKQYVAFASGNVSRMTFGATGSPSLVIYGLDGKGSGATTGSAAGSGAQAAAGKPDASHGKSIYAKVCSACHGASGEGAVGPKLQGLSRKMDQDQTVQWIRNPSAKMPKLYPSPLDAQAVADVAAYVQGL